MNKILNKFWSKFDFISILSLIFSFFLFGYVLYRSEFVHSGNLGNYYFKYYALSISLIFFSIIFVFFSNSLKKKLVLTISSLLISFYMVEVSLAFFENYSKKIQKNKTQKEIEFKIKEYNKINEKKYDIRTKIEVYEDLIKKNSNIGATLTPTTIKIKNEKLIYPLSSSSSHILTLDCNENGYYSKFLSDRYGYNNPDNEWDKNEHILFIGDSFVHGSCVRQNDTISSKLIKLINNDIGILNLGVGNTGPLTHLAIFKEYVSKLKSKKVFWFFYEGNDLDNLEDELKNSLLRRYLDEKSFIQNITLYQREIDNLYTKVINDTYLLKKKELGLTKTQRSERANLIQFLTFNKLRKTVKKFLYAPPVNEFINIMQTAQILANEKNIELNVIYLPDFSRYKNKKTLKFDNYGKIIKSLNNLNMNILDLKSKLDNHKDLYSLFPIGLTGHFNPKGTDFVANLIFKKFFN